MSGSDIINSQKSLHELAKIKFQLKHPEIQCLHDLVRLGKQDPKVAKILKSNHVVNKAKFQRNLRDAINDCINDNNYANIDQYEKMQRFIKKHVHTDFLYLGAGYTPCIPTKQEAVAIVNSAINRLEYNEIFEPF